jgi:hypothetical protein
MLQPTDLTHTESVVNSKFLTEVNETPLIMQTNNRMGIKWAL